MCLAESFLHDSIGRAAAVRLTPDGSEEYAPTEGQQLDVRAGSNGGGPRYVPEESDLTEFRTGALGTNMTPTDADLHRAGYDDIDEVARFSFLDHDVSLEGPNGFEVAGETLENHRAERLEHWDSPEQHQFLDGDHG